MPSFDSISIRLASPEEIRERSSGEITSPRITPEYESFEEGGLFCEKIFGSTKNYECRCGEYKGIRYNGVTCEKCGVDVAPTHTYRCQCGRCTGTGYRNITCPQCGTEVVRQEKRRSRMGHISLSVPVVHSWYFKTPPCKIGALLGLSRKDLERVIYYEKYIVVQPGAAEGLGVKENELLTEEEYYEILSQVRDDNDRLRDDDPEKFIAEIGGEAIETLLGRLDLDKLAQDLRFQVKTETSQQRKAEAQKRLKIVEAFREANRGGENRPEWMVMEVLPVIPPDLRPITESEGTFVTSGLNDLYKNVLIRNERLQRLMRVRAPEVILRREKRMLQEAVDALIDNSRTDSPAQGRSDRPLKSLSDRLKGKQGRFRQNLLGKRVDYSGRSVIVSGPHLKLHQCGLPKQMAVELFKPFIIRRLLDREVVETKQEGETYLEEKKYLAENPEEIWEILERELQARPVLLNRAPTLHRLSIQAFEPVLTENRAIELHPLVCPAYNADFDGDQMAVHVPLSPEACLECIDLMQSSRGLLSPANGEPVAVPTQDMLLGLYDLTKAKSNQKGEGMRFAGPGEVRRAYDQGAVSTHAKIQLRDPDGSGEMIATTVGRVLLNDALPEEVAFVNEVLTSKNIRPLLQRVLHTSGFEKTAGVLDRLKRLGFEQATRSGRTFSLADIPEPEEKARLLGEAEKQVEEVEKQRLMGYISEDERYNRVISIWSETTDRVSEALFRALEKDQAGFNPIYMMADSGARGSQEQIRQLGGMRGPMERLQAGGESGGRETLETPIRSSFKDGLSVQEYFLSTHGARKGLADTALKTADAGYLTRRLVEVGQRVMVTERDCGTASGRSVRALKDQHVETDEVIAPLKERIAGRVAAKEVRDPETGKQIARAGALIGGATAEKIEETSIEEVELRSVLTCEAEEGVCALCYGRDPATQQMVEVGEPVGTVAAQAIGEPGTQLTLRTFHTGGTAGEDITGGLPRLEALFEAREPGAPAILSKTGGTVRFGEEDEDAREIIVCGPDGETEERYAVSTDRTVIVQEGDSVEVGDRLTGGTALPQEVLALRGLRAAEEHLLREIQRIYRQHGVEVAGKHFECILRQMTTHVEITDPGDAPGLKGPSLMEGSVVHRRKLAEANAELQDRVVIVDPGGADELKRGQVATPRELYVAREKLKRHDKPGIETRKTRSATGRPLILGLTERALARDSWISAASFQQTTKVLSRAALGAETDLLDGIKENVAVGLPIPAGTGQGTYRGLDVSPRRDKDGSGDEP